LLGVAIGCGYRLPVGPDRAVESRLNGLLLSLKIDRFHTGVLEEVLGEGHRLWRWYGMVVGPRAVMVGRARRQTVVGLTYGKPVAKIGVTEAPTSDTVIPRLIATSNVVVGQLFHCLERVETASVDR